MNSRKMDTTSVFAITALLVAGLATVAMIAAAFGAFDSSDADPPAVDADDGNDGDDGATADPNADATEIAASSATAMAAVTSVEFELERGGAPIFIDEFERIALDSLRGQFSVPGRAQAELNVTVNDNLATRLGAVAVDDEVWISNPVTGDFETLPSGYDIDPSKFFDPENGWGPLLGSLQDVSLVAVDDRGGERYHITGTAPAEQVSNITVGLVQGQDVAVDLWVHPDTFLVTAAEFETTIGEATSQWALELDRYGDTFEIEPPANVRTAETGSRDRRAMAEIDTPADRAQATFAAAILAVVGFSVFVAADDLTVVSTMLRPIIGDLGLVLPDGLDDAAWIVNAYLIAFVAVMPIAGRISDVIGRRRTFVGAYLLFLLGSIVIPASTGFDEPFGWFLFGRILTALGGGAMVPVALAVIGDVYPEGRTGASARHARRDRDDGLGVGPALRRGAGAPALVAMAVLAQHPAGDHRTGRIVVGAGRPRPTAARGARSTGSAPPC